MTERFQDLLAWLEGLETLKNHSFSSPVPASSDASFRRYYRIELTEEGHGAKTSYIIMDAPPDHEDCRPFIQVGSQLLEMGVNVPQVLEQDLSQGFLLLTDLGSTTYLSMLDASNVDSFYREALETLALMQAEGGRYLDSLPEYDSTLLTAEMALFDDWLGVRHLECPMSKLQKIQWQQVQEVLIRSALAQPQVYVHRDYHSRNLMVTPDHNPGVLDFQDAVKGPLTYDAVSLLRDCYVRWPSEQVREWQREYFLMLVQKRLVSRDEWQAFLQSMDWMGIQRHLKASGIFARLYHRDGKPGYLSDIPNTLAYIVEVGSAYSEMRFLVDWVERGLSPKLASVEYDQEAG